jgi:hypothetical protein
VQKCNWERGFFRPWLLVSALMLSIGIVISASEPKALLPVITGIMAFLAGLFVFGYAMRWVLQGFKRND